MPRTWDRTTTMDLRNPQHCQRGGVQYADGVVLAGVLAKVDRVAAEHLNVAGDRGGDDHRVGSAHQETAERCLEDACGCVENAGFAEDNGVGDEVVQRPDELLESDIEW